MKVIAVEQNSKPWKEWRNKGLGASVAATVLGCNPYGSKFELWLELTGLCERATPNEFAAAAMKRGQELEPAARLLVEKEMGMLFPPLSAEHDEHDFIRASPDGFNLAANHGLEIKCPGKEAHAQAVKASAANDGKLIPKHYYAQVQQQMLVTGADLWTYASWDGKAKETVKVTVFPDLEYQAILKAALIQFWSLVQMQIPPAVEPKDLKNIEARIKDATKRLVQAQKALTIYMESI